MAIVASNSLTVSNVNDGTITHTAYAYSADGTDRFTTVYPKPNLLNGTKVHDIFKGTGTTNAGGTQKYTLDKSLKISDLKLSRYQDLIFEFDWKATGTNPSGTFVYQTQTYYKGTSVTVSPTNTSGHVKNTFYNLPVTTDTSTFMNIRQDNIPTTVTVEISNVMMYIVDYSPWMPSSSEVTTADWPSYIGQYTDFTQADSTNPSDYTWSLIRGNDGAAGPQGPQGPTGPAGSNGNPGTSAINIDLSNKSYNFLANLEVSDSGSVMQAVAGSTTTTFTALQGTAAINITALTCTTTLPTGMTVSIGTLNALSVVVTISVDNTMITPNGVLNFSITAGGVTTTKSFSYSLAINDLTVINLAAINSNLGNVKNIYSHYNGSDGGTYSGTIEINDENIKITATNDNNSNEVSKTQMNGENGIWHSTKLQKTNSPGVYVLSNWSLTGATLSFESQQSDLTYPNGYYYASYGIDVHARNIVGDSISQTNDVRTWTPITLNNVTSAVLMYQIINGVIHLNGQGNWGSFT
ncbi:phage tail protein, partial [Lactococcus sp. EKM203L]